MRPLLLTSLFLTLAVPASAQPHRRTVLDYFKMIPVSAGLFDQPNLRLTQLRAGFDSELKPPYRSIVDIPNDFLHFPGDGAQPTLDVAVFRYHGQETLAVYNHFEQGELSFWRLSNGRLHKVTKSIFPFRFPTSSVVLPRKGTTIQILRGNGYNAPQTQQVIARIGWRSGKFYRVSR